MKKYIQTKRMPGATHIKIEVRYELGGFNYFTYKTEPRGIYISVSPVTLEDRPGGYQMETYTAFSGRKFCVRELKRKSEKALQEIIAKVEPKAEAIARAFEGWGAEGVSNFISEMGL